MKDIFKGVTIKILSIVVIAAILAGGAYMAYRSVVNKAPKVEHETSTNIDVVKEKLKTVAELNTGNYLCTVVLTKSDSKKIKGWKIPLTEKSYIISYDASVKAGIKDLTQAEVTKNGETITIKLPDVEITNIEIDNDSFKKLDQSNNIFNPINIEDLNNAQKELKASVEDQAIERGVLNLAKTNAEEVIKGIVASPTNEYDIEIEWQ